jgi:large subunit ribosomal protein L30e
MIDVDKAIATAVKTGKVIFGTRQAVRNARTGKARLIILASNALQKVRDDLEYYGKLSQIPIYTHKGTSIDLGVICGRPFVISALTVKEPGDSDVLGLGEKAEPIQDVTDEKTEES